MKITLDADLCEVHGDCVVAAPEVFDIGEDDEVVHILNPTPGEDLRAQVEQAIKMCPVGALKLEG